MLKRVLSKKVAAAGLLSLLALLLYFLGVKLLFLPVLVCLGVWLLPLPTIFASWFGRAVVSLLLTFGLVQIAASLQFLLFPSSGFVVLATITWLLELAVWACAPRNESKKHSLISSTDICGLLVMLCFVVPFAQTLAGHSAPSKIAEIGSEQAIDATNHFATTNELMHAQHLNYAPGYYYPKGYHVAEAFAQNTLFRNQFSLGWAGNARLYFADYLLYASLLALAAYYLCISWLKVLRASLVPDGWSWSKLLVAACLAPSLTLFYQLPFLNEGFLSYYYTCVTLVIGLLFLGELKVSLKTASSSLDLKRDVNGRWWMLGFLILLFGASATWPLLLPPFVLIAAMFLLPAGLQWRTLLDRLITPAGIPVIIAFAVQLIPIYFQDKYSSMGTAASLNLTGSLNQPHTLVLLAGLALVAGFLVAAKVEAAYKRLIASIFLPLFAFEAALILFQLFTTGQILYYAIKVSMLIEILILALGVAGLVWVFSESKIYEARYWWLVPVLPFFTLLLLVGTINNPLNDVREIFRSKANDVIPQYMQQDVATNIRLGTAGKIKHFNMTELHYDATKGKFFADMQVTYWADQMQYEAGPEDFKAEMCIGGIYGNLAFGTYSDAEQIAVIRQIKQCAAMAKLRDLAFYIVTDPQSDPYVHRTFGSAVTIVND